MNILARIFGSTPPAPPPDEVQEVSTSTVELDYQETLGAAWGTFVETFVSLYGAPSLVQSCGPGRVTGFASLNGDEDGESLSRLTADDVLRELTHEWQTQLTIAPTPRALVVELQQAEGLNHPFVIFLYPEVSEITPTFSEWAANRAQLDAVRDRSNQSAAPQGAVIFAKLSGANDNQGDGSVWMNQKARDHSEAKAQQISEGIQRLVAANAAQSAENGPETAPITSKKKPQTPQTR